VRKVKVRTGDCREVMARMRDGYADSIVTDPPYALDFMGKDWDAAIPGPEYWREALRVIKPGGYLVAFGGTRTFHRLACAIEDAGWEIRDCLSWLYGTGFPKSHNLQGEWAGWGTALKPAWEPILLCRAPFRGTVAANVAAHGTGALNIDACRIPLREGDGWDVPVPDTKIQRPSVTAAFQDLPETYRHPEGIRATPHEAGRWPANVALDAEAAALLGEPSRFYFCTKASRRERERGLEQLAPRKRDETRNADQPSMNGGSGNPYNRGAAEVRNNHPTVKPLALMRWLVRLVTPPKGIVLDPFAGSGTTGLAALLEGFRAVLIERDPHYAEIARARCASKEAA
jgi:DNA modification methylase